MKTILLLLLSCIAARGAENLTLGWDDPQAGVTYRVEVASINAPNAWATVRENIPQYTGPARPAPENDDHEVALGPYPAGQWLFRVFAVATTGLESDPSDLLRVDIKPGAPGSPRRIKVSLQRSTDLNRWDDVHSAVEDAGALAYYRTSVQPLP